MKKKVSLKDIATAAGVSTALVSYVLTNKEQQARVGKEIAKKIRHIARKLNYQPNHIARSLKSGRSYTIGLVVADISNPFFANIARTVEDEAKRNNYTVIFGSSDESADKAADLINVLLNRQVDGLIITPTEGAEQQIKQLQERKVPFVLIDRYFPAIASNNISINNYESAYTAVEHLINNGRKRVGMIAYKTSLHHINERKRGYTEAMRDHKLLQKTSMLKMARYAHIQEDVQLAIDELMRLRKPPDALFFATNSLALHGLKYLTELGTRIPEELAVVSFDEGEAFDLFYSPVTFVRQPILGMGNASVRLLLEQINDPKKEIEHIRIDTELVIRKSSGSK